MCVLSKRLKLIRQHRGFTQRQLAKMLNVSPSTIALYETGNRSPDPAMLKRLADFLDCSVDWLLGRVGPEDIQQFNGAFNWANVPDFRKKEILAAHRRDDITQELPEEARRSLEEFQDYILKKYGKK
jgi:transcriptional regulator with XRE-family HTH domain